MRLYLYLPKQLSRCQSVGKLKKKLDADAIIVGLKKKLKPLKAGAPLDTQT
jgi:hypothetical protein